MVRSLRSLTGAPFGMRAMSPRPFGPGSAPCSWFARCARSRRGILVARQGGPHRPAAQVAAGDVEPSAAGRGPLGHPPEPVAGAVEGRGLAAVAVVVDRDHQLAGLLP